LNPGNGSSELTTTADHAGVPPCVRSQWPYLSGASRLLLRRDSLEFCDAVAILTGPVMAGNGRRTAVRLHRATMAINELLSVDPRANQVHYPTQLDEGNVLAVTLPPKTSPATSYRRVNHRSASMCLSRGTVDSWARAISTS
jgi:hypothetical protein